MAKDDDIDENFISILHYNQACCYQCMNNLGECWKQLKLAIKAAKEKLSQIDSKLNKSYDVDFPTDCDAGPNLKT